MYRARLAQSKSDPKQDTSSEQDDGGARAFSPLGLPRRLRGGLVPTDERDVHRARRARRRLLRISLCGQPELQVEAPRRRRGLRIARQRFTPLRVAGDHGGLVAPTERHAHSPRHRELECQRPQYAALEHSCAHAHTYGIELAPGEPSIPVDASSHARGRGVQGRSRAGDAAAAVA